MKHLSFLPILFFLLFFCQNDQQSFIVGNKKSTKPFIAPVYDTTSNNIMNKSIEDLLYIIREAKKRNIHKKEYRKIKYNYFDFNIFLPRQDTSVWHTSFAEVTYDKNKKILSIHNYGLESSEENKIGKESMNFNYDIYEYNDQYRVIICDRNGGYLTKNKLNENEKYTLIIIIQDKKYGINVYMDIHNSKDIFDKAYKNCAFINNIGFLYPNLLVQHRLRFGNNRQFGRIGKITSYRKYTNQNGLNIKTFDFVDSESEWLFSCEISTKMKNLWKNINIWEEKYKLNEQKKELEDDVEYNFHLPAYSNNY